MRQTLLRLLFLIGLSVTGTWQVSHPLEREDQQAAKQPAFDPNGGQMDQRAVICYVNGLALKITGDYSGALLSFREALRYFPQSDAIRLELAQLCLGAQQPVEAIKYMDQIRVKDADYYRLLGTCYQTTGDVGRARDAYLQLAILEPDNQYALGYLADFYRRAYDTTSAIWAMEHLSNLVSNTTLWNELGQMYLARGQNDKAKDAFGASLTIDGSGENNLPRTILADIYLDEQKYDSATAVVARGLELDKDSPFLNLQMLNIWWRQDSVRQALPYAKRLVDLRPADGRYQRRLGLIYFRLDSLDAASKIFGAILEHGEGLAADYYFMGQIQLAKKQFDQASANFSRLTEMEDSVAGNWINLSFAYLQMKDTARALDAFRAGIPRVKGDSGQIRLWYSIGSIQERWGRFDSSTATFRQLLAQWPDYAPALNYLGYMYAEKGINLDSARNLIERALKAEPNNAAFLDSYGWVLFKLNQYGPAIEYLQKAADQTKDAVVMEHLGDAYFASGDKNKARGYWQQSLELDPTNKGVKEKLHK